MNVGVFGQGDVDVRHEDRSSWSWINETQCIDGDPMSEVRLHEEERYEGGKGVTTTLNTKWYRLHASLEGEMSWPERRPALFVVNPSRSALFF